MPFVKHISSYARHAADLEGSILYTWPDKAQLWRLLLDGSFEEQGLFFFFFLTYLAFTIFPALNSTISSNPTANMSGGQLSSSVEKGEKSHKSYYFVVSSNDLFSNFCQRSFLVVLSCVFPAKLIHIHCSFNLISQTTPAVPLKFFSCLSPNSWSPSLSCRKRFRIEHYIVAVLRWENIHCSFSLTPHIPKTQHLTTHHFSPTFHPTCLSFSFSFLTLFPK